MKRRYWLPVAVLLLASSCAHKQVQAIDEDICILDPDHNQAICSGPSFDSQGVRPTPKLSHWICRSPEADQKLMNACYLERARNGK